MSLVIPVANEPNKFIIGLGRSLRVLEWDGNSEADTSNLKSLHVVHDDNLGGRFNDGKCDSSGRLWAGKLQNNTYKVSMQLILSFKNLHFVVILHYDSRNNGVLRSGTH